MIWRRAWRFPSPQRDGLRSPTLRKVREEWAALGSGWRRLTAVFLSPPSGLVISPLFFPTAYAVGCILSPLCGFGPFPSACGTTEVVPFPGVALSKSSEGWSCGIPLFGFAQGRLLRKVREEWGSLFRGGVGLQRVPHRAFSPVRNDKICGGLRRG